MITYAFRLRRGDDLRQSLEAYVQEHHIKAAVILSCVGCVSHVRLRDASGVNIRDVNEHCEIVSATGTLGEKRLHVHVSFSREDLSTIGGHLCSGCIVNTTAEVVLGVVEGVAFEPVFDAETGYDELNIRKIEGND